MADAMLGPTGGKGGDEFLDYTVPAGARISAVHVYAHGYVDAIQLVSKVADGEAVALPRIGGHSGHDYVFTLDDDEYLTGISGRSGVYVDSIRFHTNKRTSDTYGGHGGENEYQFEVAPNTEVAGFFGRAGWFIDALGLIARLRAAAAEAPAAAPAVVAEAPVVKTPAVKAPAKKATKAAAAVPLSEETAPAPVEAAAAAVAPAEAPVKKTTKAASKAAPKTKDAAAPAPVPAAEAPKPAKAPAKAASKAPAKVVAPAAPDDLEKIEGIGPKIAALLAENGITTFAALAAAPVEQLRTILSGAGARYRIADPATWPQQAALAASGDTAGLEKLQAELRAGRKS